MNKFFVATVLILAAASGGYFYHLTQQQEQNPFVLEYNVERPVNPFSLTDQHGNAFSNQQLKGKWSFVFFGYTSCPDICPTTLQELNFVYPQLKDISSDAQILLVSVDPNRDTPEKLKQYINYFNPEFWALSAGHDVLFPFARNLGLMYAIADDTSEEYYLVDHSGSIVLINPEGNISTIYKPEQAPGMVPSVNTETILQHFKSLADS